MFSFSLQPGRKAELVDVLQLSETVTDHLQTALSQAPPGILADCPAQDWLPSPQPVLQAGGDDDEVILAHLVHPQVPEQLSDSVHMPLCYTLLDEGVGGVWMKDNE